MKRKRTTSGTQPEEAGSQPYLRWERKISGNQWQVFPVEKSEVLNQATRAHKLAENLGDDQVDLCKMLQRNKESGQENRVRMAIWDQNSYFVWQWEGDQENEWIPYPAAISLDLQAAKNGHREPIVDFTFGQISYKLDTARMVQTNQQTKFERRIEYKQSDAIEGEVGSLLSSSDLEASTWVPAEKSQIELGASTSQAQGDEMDAIKAEVESLLSSSDLEASTWLPVEKSQIALGASTSHAQGDEMDAIEAEVESLLSSGLEASIWVPAEKSQIDLGAFTSQGQGDGMGAREIQVESLLSSSGLEAITSAPAEKSLIELGASTSQGQGDGIGAREIQVESLLSSSGLEAITSAPAEKSLIELVASTSQGQGDGIDATEAVVESLLSSSELEASTSAPAKKSQTKLGASTSQGQGDGMDATEAVVEPLLSSSELEASTSAPAKTSQTELGASTSQGQGDGMEAVKTLTVKGKAPVDSECKAKLGKAHVYCEGDDIYDVMLNQTNLQFNNNKFYLIQLLEDDNAPNYSVWMRWGRVGKPGQNTIVPCSGDLAKAKEVFTKKFLDKTKNEWDKRANFQKVTGKYDLLHLDYEAKDAESSGAAPENTVSKPQPVSQLDLRLQALVELICNIRTMEEMVIEMKYDTRKAPLGKLTDEQIKAGYQSLQKVEACLKRSQTGSVLLEACNEFYTRIPHDFGLKTPPLIKTLKELQDKAQLLEALGEIHIGIRHVQSEQLDLEHPLDRSYRSLDCELHPLEKASDVFQVLERYLLSTHAPTHKNYTMTLIEVFEVNKKCSEATFRFDLPNRMLLWHGSRLGNWAGILSQGLRVAPPEAPVTGYMFGKGIYFADMSSKSANYCFATREKDIGFLLLSEVALGECNELLEANPEAEKLPVSKHSTKGLGKLAPSGCVSLQGAIVPVGPPKETGISNANGYTLNYNEFVVYDPCQVRMKYLLKVRFNFKQLW